MASRPSWPSKPLRPTAPATFLMLVAGRLCKTIHPLSTTFQGVGLGWSRPQHAEGPIPPHARCERKVNPQHTERFEEACGGAVTRIDCLKADVLDELEDGRFAGLVIATHEHHRPPPIHNRVRHVVEAGLVERLEDLGTLRPLDHLLQTGRGVADSQLGEVGRQGIGAVDYDLAREVARLFDCTLGGLPRGRQNDDLSEGSGLRHRPGLSLRADPPDQVLGLGVLGVGNPLLLTSSLALNSLGSHHFRYQDDFSQGGNRNGCCRDAGTFGQDTLGGSRGARYFLLWETTARLQAIFDKERGRCYDDVIKFPNLVAFDR